VQIQNLLFGSFVYNTLNVRWQKPKTESKTTFLKSENQTENHNIKKPKSYFENRTCLNRMAWKNRKMYRVAQKIQQISLASNEHSGPKSKVRNQKLWLATIVYGNTKAKQDISVSSFISCTSHADKTMINTSLPYTVVAFAKTRLTEPAKMQLFVQ